MYRIVLIAVALFGILGVGAVAGADGPTISRAWLFGDCSIENGEIEVRTASHTAGCRGFGIFIGGFDRDSLIEAVRAEAEEEAGTTVTFTKLVAIPVPAQFSSPVILSASGDACPFPRNTPWGAAPPPQASGGPGFWIAWFAVEPCTDIYAFGDDPSPAAFPGGSPHIILGPGYPSSLITFRLPEGLLLEELTEISADVFVESADVCELYTPAFWIDTDRNGDSFADGNVRVPLGAWNGAPDCIAGTWQNTGNLVQPGRLIGTENQIGGELSQEYSEAMEEYGGLTVTRIYLSSYAATARFDNIVINGRLYTFDELVD